MLPLRIRIVLEYVFCIAVIGVVAAVALHPTVVRGYVPIDTSSVLFSPPWEEARPAGLDIPIRPESNLMARRFFPWFRYMSEASMRGHSLLWNPIEACGTPFMALWKTRCLSPFSLPFRVFPLTQAFRVSAMLKILVAGLCAFYAARRLGFSMPLALFVAVSFELSGHLMLWLNWPIADAVPWLPLLFLFVERLTINQYRAWPVGAFVLALMLLGGAPEAVAGALLFLTLYLTLHHAIAGRDMGSLLRSLGIVAGATAAALALTAVQVVPFIEFAWHASRETRGDASPELGLLDIVLCFLPRFFGGFEKVAAGEGHNTGIQSAGVLYSGLLPMMLVPMWLACRPFTTRRQRTRIEGLLITTLVMTVVAVAFGPFMEAVPGLRWIRGHNLLVCNMLALSVVGAAAAEEWLELDARACFSALKRMVPFCLLSVGLLVGLVILAWNRNAVPGPAFVWQLAVAMGLGVAFIGLFLTTIFWRPSVRLTGYGMCAIAFLDLMTAFQLGLPAVPPDFLFPRTSFIQSLQETGGRVSGSTALREWPLSGNLIPEVYGSSGMQLARHRAFIDRVALDPLLLRRSGSPSLLLTKEDIQGPFAEIRPMLQIRRVFPSGAVLFEDLDTEPRVWMAYEGRPVSTFDPAQLLSSEPPLMEGIVPPGHDDGEKARPEILEENPIRVHVHVEKTQPGVLVLADTWYPGWKALVDGQPARIGVVDGLFRGVVVPEGTHNIVFRYEPLSLTLGLIISGVAAVIVLTALVPFVLEVIRKRDRWARYY